MGVWKTNNYFVLLQRQMIWTVITMVTSMNGIGQKPIKRPLSFDKDSQELSVLPST